MKPKLTREQQIRAYFEAGHRWVFTYYKGVFVSYLDEEYAETVQDAIKWFNNHHSAELTIMWDTKNHVLYYGKTNDVPDYRGNFNQSFYTKEGKCVYNSDPPTPSIIKRAAITKRSKDGYIDTEGHFYECEPEGHEYLANELFYTKTVNAPVYVKGENAQRKLELMGWIKISAADFYFVCDKITKKQQKTMTRYMAIIGDEKYSCNGRMLTPDQIEKMFENY